MPVSVVSTPSVTYRRLSFLYAASALFALGVGVFAGQPVQASWGRWAAVGYLAATLLTLLKRETAAIGAALLGAVVAPLVWLVTGGSGMSTVGMGALTVVKRAGTLLLAHGTPYLPADQLTGPESLNPYGPALAVFGLPHALGATGWAGNPRTWFGLSAAVLLYLALRRFEVLRPGRAVVALFASPVLALPFVLGGTDLPVLGLLACAFALLHGRPQPVLAGIALGLACAMKAIAWPAALVLLAMLVMRRDRRDAIRLTAAGLASAAVAIAVTVPAVFVSADDLLRNTVLFPLRFTEQKTTAASPMPGHLVALTGTTGATVMTVLLAAFVLAACVYVARRPAPDVRIAARQLAVIWAVVFAAAPAARFGYYIYPILLLSLWAFRRRPAIRPSAVQPAASAAPGSRR